SCPRKAWFFPLLPANDCSPTMYVPFGILIVPPFAAFTFAATDRNAGVSFVLPSPAAPDCLGLYCENAERLDRIKNEKLKIKNFMRVFEMQFIQIPARD